MQTLNQRQPLYVFALNSTMTKEDELEFVRSHFPGAKQVQGCYKGVMERSYIVPATNDNWKKMLNMCSTFKQESIMYIDESRRAYLYYLNLESSVSIGKLCVTSPADAMDNHDAWTRDGSTFYVTR